MKRIALYLLLPVLLFNSAGYYLMFEWRREQIREEMSTALLNRVGKQVVLTIPDNASPGDFRRIHSREFFYKGSLYDIISESRAGNATVFICVHDKKESRLLAYLEQASREKKDLTLVHGPLLFFNPLSRLDLTPDRPLESLMICRPVGLVTTILTVWSPPPEIV